MFVNRVRESLQVYGRLVRTDLTKVHPELVASSQ